MIFLPDHIYHIYNRGNNQQRVFFTPENYNYYLKKVSKEILPFCDILAYCLMPNHFHFMVWIKPTSTGQTTESGQTGNKIPPLVRGIAKLLSSYTQAINKQESRTGSLFQQKTKAKILNPSRRTWKSSLDYLDYYPYICINYLHQNPIVSGLTKRMEDWEFSSFREYVGLSSISLCNKDKTFELIPFFTDKNFKELSYQMIKQEQLDNIF